LPKRRRSRVDTVHRRRSAVLKAFQKLSKVKITTPLYTAGDKL
jgi:hypothetical protein